MIYAQESLVDEIIVDNFAGGGSASTGIELAVCPPMATALGRANLPEWCGAEITTMAQLTDCVAV